MESKEYYKIYSLKHGLIIICFYPLTVSNNLVLVDPIISIKFIASYPALGLELFYLFLYQLAKMIWYQIYGNSVASHCYLVLGLRLFLSFLLTSEKNMELVTKIVLGLRLFFSFLLTSQKNIELF